MTSMARLSILGLLFSTAKLSPRDPFFFFFLGGFASSGFLMLQKTSGNC